MHSVETNETAVVTGGSSGIGLSIANELARLGYDIILVSNQYEALENAKRDLISKYKINCSIIYQDLTDRNAGDIVFNKSLEISKSIIILVNNAGMLLFSEMIEIEKGKVEKILQLHITTPTILCNLFGAYMKEKKCGHILNIASISAVMPYPGISLYGPTKTYLKYFSRAIRYELKPHNVNVSVALPGATETNLYDPNKINLQLAKKIRIMKTSDDVAKKCIHGLFKNKSIIIPGIMNKLTVLFLPLIPSRLIYFLYRNTSLIHQGKKSL